MSQAQTMIRVKRKDKVTFPIRKYTVVKHENDIILNN